MMRRRRRTWWLLPPAGLVLAALALATSTAVAATRTDHRAAPSYQPCGNGAECAAIQVPLDWARPDRAQITIAFAVHRAADPARRIGTLVFVNGTGVSSQQFVADRMGRGAFPAELINRFDIVGVDPRGGGAHPNNTPLPLPVRSTALHCDQPPHQPGSRYFPATCPGPKRGHRG